jgi:hypothetical protein
MRNGPTERATMMLDRNIFEETYDSSRWCQQAVLSLTWNTRMHWNPCCVSWHKEIYHKSRWTGKNGSYSKEKSITSWMRLGLNKSAAAISPLMENITTPDIKATLNTQPPSLVCHSYKKPSRSRKKWNAATKRLIFSANMQKGMSDKHTQD